MHTPYKEDTRESQKLYPHFSSEISPKISPYLVARVKQFWIIFSTKNENSQLFTAFDMKIGNSHFLPFFRIPIFKVIIQAWEFPNF